MGYIDGKDSVGTFDSTVDGSTGILVQSTLDVNFKCNFPNRLI
jgi:hypothetical protein